MSLFGYHALMLEKCYENTVKIGKPETTLFA